MSEHACTVCNQSNHAAESHGVALCSHGHPLVGWNTYKTGDCKACHKAAVRRYYWRLKEGREERHDCDCICHDPRKERKTRLGSLA